MVRILLFVFAFIAVCSLGLALTCDKENEEPQCLLHCELSRECRNRNVGSGCSPLTGEVCKESCGCKKPYFRSSVSGECVTYRQCDIEDPPKEEKQNKRPTKKRPSNDKHDDWA